MVFCFPRHVFDEIWDLIGSVSESFPNYFLVSEKRNPNPGSFIYYYSSFFFGGGGGGGVNG